MLLQSSFGTKKIDAKYLQGYRPIKKEIEDSRKNKSIDIFFANIPSKKQQFSTYQTNKKDQNY